MATSDDVDPSKPALVGGWMATATRLAHAKRAVFVFSRGFLIATSFVTTAYGAFLLYVSASPGDGALGWLAYVIPFVGAGYLHKLIIDWFNLYAQGRRNSLIIGIVGLQFIAIVLSFGTHWTHFQGRAETIGSFEQTQQKIVRDISAERVAFRAFVEQAEAIAKYSEERANMELKDGGTCGPVGAGDGPRRRLRQEDQHIFADARAQAEKRLVDLDAILNSATGLAARDAREAASNSGELKRIVNRVREFEADPFIGSLKRTAEERLARGLGPIPIAAGHSRIGAATFSCPDPVLAQHLKDMLAAIAVVRPIGEVVFTDYTNPRSGVRAAISRLLGSLSFGIWTESPREQRLRLINGANSTEALGNGLQPDDWLALVWAFFIEGLLFLSYTVGVRRPSFPQADGLEDIRAALDKNGKGHFGQLWRTMHCESELLKVIDRHLFWNWWGGARIFVPVDCADEEAVRLRHLLELAASARIVRRGVTGWFWPWVMAIGWNAEYRKRIFAASQVRTYVLSNADVAALLLQCLGSESTFGAGPANATAAATSRMDERDPRRAGFIRPVVREAS